MIDTEKLFIKTQEAFDKKNYDYAIDLAKNILEVSPEHAQARQILRTSTLRSYEIKGGIPSGFKAVLAGFIPLVKIFFFSILGKKSVKAIATCEEYLAKNPMSIWGRTKLANLLQQMSYLEAAIAEYEGIVTLNATHLISLKALGELYRAKQDIPKANEYYKKAFSLNPADNESARALKDLAALTTIQKGGWAGAKSSRDVIKDKAKAVELEKASQLSKGAGEVDDELKQLEATIQHDPTNPQNVPTFKKIGELYIQKKQYKKAESVYQQAFKLAPSDGTISMRLGDIKMMLYEQELSRLQKEFTTHPTNQSLKSQIENLKAERRKFQIEEYRRRVQLHPTDMNLHFQLGVALYNAGQIDEAIAEFQDSTRDPRRRVESHKYLGLSFSQKHLYDMAVEQFKKALESAALTTEQTKELRYALGDAYEKNKNYKEARDEYKKILEIDFNYKDGKIAQKVEQLKEYG